MRRNAGEGDRAGIPQLSPHAHLLPGSPTDQIQPEVRGQGSPGRGTRPRRAQHGAGGGGGAWSAASGDGVQRRVAQAAVHKRVRGRFAAILASLSPLPPTVLPETSERYPMGPPPLHYHKAQQVSGPDLNAHLTGSCQDRED